FSLLPRPPISPLFPYTTLFRSDDNLAFRSRLLPAQWLDVAQAESARQLIVDAIGSIVEGGVRAVHRDAGAGQRPKHATLRVRGRDRKSTRLNSSHVSSSYAVFC